MSLADNVATTAPKREHRQPLVSDMRFRVVVLTITGAITTGLAAVVTSNWPIALLIAALIVVTTALALFVAERLNEFREGAAEQDEKLERCEKGHEACKDDLHTRDVLLAMFTVSMKPTGPKARRRGDHMPPALEAAFRKTLGPERADDVITRARALLASD